MLKRRKATKMGVRKSERIRSTGHQQFVRGFVCLAFDRDPTGCDGKMHAHHVSEGGNAGMGVKAPDSDLVPLCAKHHDEGHTGGWTTFAVKYSVDLLAHAAKLWRISPHRKKWEEAQR